MGEQEDFYRKSLSEHPSSNPAFRPAGAVLPKPAFDPFPKLTAFLLQLWATICQFIQLASNDDAIFDLPKLDLIQRLIPPFVSLSLRFSSFYF
jgi:hypothetical protein